MTRTKTPLELAINASKLHKYIGDLLANELFSNLEIRQEYPVNKVNPGFKSGREKFDWVILGIKVVIEVHGRQHYTPVCFGGISADKAKADFHKRLKSDERKEIAAKEAGWSYLVIKHDEKNITAEELLDKILNAVHTETQPAKCFTTTRHINKIKQPKQYKWPTRKIPSRPFDKGIKMTKSIIIKCVNCGEDQEYNGRFDENMDEIIICINCGIASSKWTYEYIKEVENNGGE
jgi:very-short-patch-repair endonuclease